MDIQQKLIDCASEWIKGQKIKELRFGLGYSSVELANGRMGIVGTPSDNADSCTHIRSAGKIAGMAAGELLGWLASNHPLERAAGLATFNALNAGNKRSCLEEEAISLLKIQKTDHVVMVGYFAPLVPGIKTTGCSFEIIELKSEKPGVITPEQGYKALEKCDIAIITSTSIINGTCNSLLKALKRNRAAVLLGPSTPMCPEAFSGTRITQWSGSYVLNTERVKTIISEAGGTMLLKKYLRFTTVKANHTE